MKKLLSLLLAACLLILTATGCQPSPNVSEASSVIVQTSSAGLSSQAPPSSAPASSAAPVSSQTTSSAPAPKLNLSFQPSWNRNNFDDEFYINSNNELVFYDMEKIYPEDHERFQWWKARYEHQYSTWKIRNNVENICSEHQLVIIADGKEVNIPLTAADIPELAKHMNEEEWQIDIDICNKMLSVHRNVESKWENLVLVETAWAYSYIEYNSCGLTADGRVLTPAKNYPGDTWSGAYCAELETWEDIVHLELDGCTMVGLKKDGTVVSASLGTPTEISPEIKDVVFMSCSKFLKKDGTLVDNENKVIAQGVCRLFPSGYCMKTDGTVYNITGEEPTYAGRYEGTVPLVQIRSMGYDDTLAASREDGTIVILRSGGNDDARAFEKYLTTLTDVKVFS